MLKLNCQKEEAISDTVDCLTDANGELHLKKQHAYHYQVQCQLLATEVKSCDFVVWTTKDFFVERIVYDRTFCTDMVESCTVFFKKAILPELVGKLYSRPLQAATPCMQDINNNQTNVTDDDGMIICIYKAKYDKANDNVIGCDDQNCPYVWFHFKCAGIKRVPKGQWLCKTCRNKN